MPCRRESWFPDGAILFDPLESVWVAASSPERLTEPLEAAGRAEAGPYESDKTQTWRILRKHGRG